MLGRGTALLWWGVWGALATGFACSQHFYWPQIGDDSFIFFRYAENLASGHGLSWNVGEPPVEGFSSPLWVLILAAAKLVGLDTITAAKAIGVVLCFGATLGSGLLALRIGRSRRAAAVAVAALLFLKPLQYWAPSGMETSLYVFVLVFAMLALAEKRPWPSGLALGLVGIARPEGPGIVLAALGVVAIVEPSRGVRYFFTTAAIAGGIVAGYAVFRGIYFGDILPNTYYAKTGGTLQARVTRGLQYVGPVLPLWGGIAILFMQLTAQGRLIGECRVAAALSVSIATLILGAVLLGGGDWMWNHRLLVPVLTLLFAVGAGMGATLIGGRAGGFSRSAALAFVVLGVPGCVILAKAGILDLGDLVSGAGGAQLPYQEIQEGTMTQTSRDVALFLRDAAQENALIAVNHAGAVPYYSGLRALDMTGLNEHHIAHQVEGGLHEKFDADYVLARRPDYIVLNSRVRPGTNGYWYIAGYWEGESALVSRPGFQASYRFLPQYWTWNWEIPENYILVAQRVGP